MELKIIKTKKQHEESLAEVERLIDLNPEQGSPEDERLSLLALLVEEYEKEHFVFQLPDPIEAIKYRMEGQGLSQSDLVPYIGSRSKVSEVLSGKRSLTKQMIRALADHLDIPLDVLIKESSKTIDGDNEKIDWQKFPLKEMVKRGWIKATTAEIKDNAEGLVRDFIGQLGADLSAAAYFKRTYHERSGKKMNEYALLAWTIRVLTVAQKDVSVKKYKENTLNEEFLKDLAQLSRFDKGPLLAKEFLAKAGIALVIEPHLTTTKLDGAALLSKDGNPIIGLTLRYDRTDNFWFILFHELVHVWKHLFKNKADFFDDLDVLSKEPLEKETDLISSDILIPMHLFQSSNAYKLCALEEIEKFAKNLKINPAIVAGQIRHKLKNYKILSSLVGHKQVQKLFKNK